MGIALEEEVSRAVKDVEDAYKEVIRQGVSPINAAAYDRFVRVLDTAVGELGGGHRDIAYFLFAKKELEPLRAPAA